MCERAITCKDTLTKDEGRKDKLRINSIRTEDKASKRTTGCSDGRSLLTNGLTDEKDGRTEDGRQNGRDLLLCSSKIERHYIVTGKLMTVRHFVFKYLWLKSRLLIG